MSKYPKWVRAMLYGVAAVAGLYTIIMFILVSDWVLGPVWGSFVFSVGMAGLCAAAYYYDGDD